MMTMMGLCQACTVGTMVLVVLGTSACAPGRSSTSARGVEPGGRETITLEELASVGTRDAYSAIQMLRPIMLEGRGATSLLGVSSSLPDVFVDGVYFGPVESLGQMPAQDLAEVRWLGMAAAGVKYGEGHPAGVIDIKTKY